MSDEMAIGGKTSSSEQILEPIGDSNDSLDGTGSAASGSIETGDGDQNPSVALNKVRKDSLTDEISEKLKAMEKDDPIDSNDERPSKRRASAAFSDDSVEEFKGFGLDEPKALPDYNRIVENVESATRRKSTSSDVSEEFKGFEISETKNLTGYNQVLERLEAELSEAVKGYTPLKTVLTAPLLRASKRTRQDTDSSRPSSALSSRSEGEGAVDASMSPANRARRPDVSSPLLRVPLESGWRRELVYRAALDAHSRRAADIYYYSPSGKKLRSMREVSEVLGGTGLTTENFSFFKEPLGIDDPEKEIIRDAKLMRRVESPVPQAAPTADSKRTPKPKPPKGVSPEPATLKSPPAKIKVKSMGSRLSNSTPTAKPGRKPQPTPPAPAAAQADNNNSAAWKKPRGAPPPLQPRPAPPPPPRVSDTAPAPISAPAPAPVPVPVPVTVPGPAAAAPPVPVPAPASASVRASVPVPAHTPIPVPVPVPVPAQRYPVGGAQRPCSMTCGRGAVPSLACAVCLCLYHPACVGATHVHGEFLCKNCRKSASPPPSPPLTHKNAPAAGPARRVPVPAKVPRADKRPAPKVKAVGGASACAGAAAAVGPQSLAIINGRRFIVVARPANT